MRWFSRRSGDSAVVTEPAPAAILPSPMESISNTPLPINYRAEGQRRDAFIVELVRRQGVLTSDLIRLAVSREHFDLPGETRQALLNRLSLPDTFAKSF